MRSNKTYLVLITFLLTCIGIKYETNPFNQSTLLLLISAVFSLVLASAADMSKSITIITFHFSGILASQTLLWILIPQFLWFSLINFLFLLLLKFLLFDFLTQLLVGSSFNCITQLFSGTPPNVAEMPNTEPQQQESQV